VFPEVKCKSPEQSNLLMNIYGIGVALGVKIIVKIYFKDNLYKNNVL